MLCCATRCYAMLCHLQEWRHAHGMQCLGIPNTKHFHGITLIEDAYTLWAKLKVEHSIA